MSNCPIPVSDCLFGVTASLGGRFWTLKPVEDAAARELAVIADGSDLIGRLLAGRDVAPDEVKSFLDPKLRDTFPDPSSLPIWTRPPL